MCMLLDTENLNDNELIFWEQTSHRNSVLCLVLMELSHCFNQEPSTSLERYFCMCYHFHFRKFLENEVLDGNCYFVLIVTYLP